MKKKELLRAVCDSCKEKGVRVTRKQARAVLESLKDVSYDTCLNGNKVHLRGFLTIEGKLTKAKILPDGKITEPRLKISVKLSEYLKEKFKNDVLEKKEEEWYIED